jgi:hypothetical protein
LEILIDIIRLRRKNVEMGKKRNKKCILLITFFMSIFIILTTFLVNIFGDSNFFVQESMKNVNNQSNYGMQIIKNGNDIPSIYKFRIPSSEFLKKLIF